MKKAEYTRLRAALVAKEGRQAGDLQRTRKQLEALDLVWSEVVNDPGSPIEGGAESDGTPAGLPDPFAGVDPDEFPARRLAREAALSMTGDFSVRDVQQAMRGGNPELTDADLDRMRPTISGTLKNMCSEEELELVQAGSGRRPSTYRVRREPPPPTA